MFLVVTNYTCMYTMRSDLNSLIYISEDPKYLKARTNRFLHIELYVSTFFYFIFSEKLPENPTGEKETQPGEELDKPDHELDQHVDRVVTKIRIGKTTTKFRKRQKLPPRIGAEEKSGKKSKRKSKTSSPAPETADAEPVAPPEITANRIFPNTSKAGSLQSFVDILSEEIERPHREYFTETFEGYEEHIPERIPGHKYQQCVYCHLHDVKTKSGWKVCTHFQCRKCRTPLCTASKSERNCFGLYHQMMFKEKS